MDFINSDNEHISTCTNKNAVLDHEQTYVPSGKQKLELDEIFTHRLSTKQEQNYSRSSCILSNSLWSY